MKVKTPPPTGILYVDVCYQIDFEEFSEPRRWQNIPRMREIPDLAFGDKQKALAAAESALREFSDYSFLYYWVAKLRGEIGFPDEPIATCLEGLQKGRNKPMLCGAIAMYEFSRFNLGHAVKWWIRSCAVQLDCRLSTDSFSLLNLAYIAEGLGLPQCQAPLLREAQLLQSIQFDAVGAEERYHLARTQGTVPMRKAIQLLCDFYIQPAK